MKSRSKERRGAFSESLSGGIANLRSRVQLEHGHWHRRYAPKNRRWMPCRNDDEERRMHAQENLPTLPYISPSSPPPSLFPPPLLLSLPPSPPPSLSFPPHGANTGHISATAHASDPPRVTSDASDDPACDGSLCRAARGIMNSRGQFAACGRILRATHLQSRGGSRGGAPRKTAPNPADPVTEPSDAF